MIKIMRLTLLIGAILTAGCQSVPATMPEKNSPFTHGNVQLTLKKGVTTQTEVLETFGAPNVATVDSDNREVWTYQKNATVSKGTESGVYGTVLILGATSTSSGFEQSSRTMTLIIKFDNSKTVTDFKSMSTSF